MNGSCLVEKRERERPAESHLIPRRIRARLTCFSRSQNRRKRRADVSALSFSPSLIIDFFFFRSFFVRSFFSFSCVPCFSLSGRMFPVRKNYSTFFFLGCQLTTQRCAKIGNTWPWCWTDFSSGYLHWPFWWERLPSFYRRLRSTTSANPSTRKSQRSSIRQGTDTSRTILAHRPTPHSF